MRRTLQVTKARVRVRVHVRVRVRGSRSRIRCGSQLTPSIPVTPIPLNQERAAPRGSARITELVLHGHDNLHLVQAV